MALKREEQSMNQRMQVTCRWWKRQKNIFSLRASKRNAALPKPLFYPNKTHFRHFPQEMYDVCVVLSHSVCDFYNINRKLIHLTHKRYKNKIYYRPNIRAQNFKEEMWEKNLCNLRL